MATSEMGKAGLIWIGERFYKTPADFLAEGRDLGISRRVKAVPRGFKVGETWVLLAHPKTVRAYVPAEPTDENAGLIPGLDEKIVFKPGIFYVWRPQRIEKILVESQRDSEEAKQLIEQGITPVFVPDNDPDHKGTAYDRPAIDEDEEEAS